MHGGVISLLLCCCYCCVVVVVIPTDIEVGFNTTSLVVSEGDGVVTQVSVGILDGGTTEQILEFIVTFNPGSKI